MKNPSYRRSPAAGRVGHPFRRCHGVRPGTFSWTLAAAFTLAGVMALALPLEPEGGGASAAGGTTAAVPAVAATPPVRVVWEQLEPGLEFAAVELPEKSEEGDSLARILRADPRSFGLRLLNASAGSHEVPRTARGWAEHAGMIAVINAAMYQADGSTSVSLMQAPGHVNNGHLSRDRTVLAFDRRDESVPPVQIIDRGCQDFEELRPSYASFVQSIRMISCKGRNVWSQQEAKWSTALIATDRGGRFLLIHVRSPYSTHDLIDNLLRLPIDIDRAMYLEGGRPAQLYFRSGERELEVVGSTSSSGIGGNRSALPFPNALGLYRLAGPPASE
jgi:hypothetical protein